jgi:hypothetical protein
MHISKSPLSCYNRGTKERRLKEERGAMDDGTGMGLGFLALSTLEHHSEVTKREESFAP